MQGIYINGDRPKSKKQVKETLATEPGDVSIEATSWFGNEFGGNVLDMKIGSSILFVGPCPHTSRKFYGEIIRKDEKVFKVI